MARTKRRLRWANWYRKPRHVWRRRDGVSTKWVLTDRDEYPVAALKEAKWQMRKELT